MKNRTRKIMNIYYAQKLIKTYLIIDTEIYPKKNRYSRKFDIIIFEHI